MTHGLKDDAGRLGRRKSSARSRPPCPGTFQVYLPLLENHLIYCGLYVNYFPKKR